MVSTKLMGVKALCWLIHRFGLSGGVVVATGLLLPLPTLAQAFLPAKGEGSVGFSFQDISSQGHLLSNGSRLSAFQSRSLTQVFDVEYGLTNRIALSAQLAYVNSKYTGKEAPLNPQPRELDDGKYHGTPQDFRLDVRYNILRKPLFVTPFAAAIVPSHRYGVIGEAAPGRKLREFLMGAYAGRLLNPILPRAYLHGAYSYSFVEREFAGVSLNRSNLDLQVGHALTRSASANFLWRRQWTHGGLSFDEIFAPSQLSVIFVNHDRLTRANFQHVSAGASYSLPRQVDLLVTYVRFVSGINEHYGRAIIVGLRRSFRTRAAK